MTYKPRQYQTDAVNNSIRFLSAPNYGLLLQSPTSSGKTFMSTAVCKFVTDNYGKAFFFVHSTSLLDSTYRDLLKQYDKDEIDIVHHFAPRMNRKVFVVMAQTFKRRMLKQWNFVWDKMGGAFFDEAHLAHFNDIALQCKERGIRRLGMTATPKRAKNSKVQLWDLYNHKITTVTEMELINNGWTVPPYPVLPEGKSTDREVLSISSRSGEAEYKRGESSKMMREKRGIYKGVGDAWKDYALKRGLTKTIAYCCDVKHVIETCNELNKQGIKSKFICSRPKAGSENHDLYTEAERNGLTGTLIHLLKRWGTDFDVLVNADMLTTGMDVPNIQSVILLRPILSENLYLQMCGRGKRACEAIDKKYYLLFDFGDNISFHGLPVIDRNYPFSPSPKRKTSGLPPMKVCPKCGQQILAMSRICNNPIYSGFELVGICGHEFPFVRLESESAFKLVEFDKILELDGNRLSAKLLRKKASIPEIYEAWENKGFQRGWLIHNIMQVHGKQGIEELVVRKGGDVQKTLEWVQKNTKYNVL